MFLKIATILGQESWDTSHIFNLDETFVPLLPFNNVGFWEKYMVMEKSFVCNNAKCLRYTNIVSGGRGVRAQHKVRNAEKVIEFNNFL